MTPLPPPDPLSRDVALFLDLDGTLTPKVPVPPGVQPDPALNRLLMRLREALGGRLAIISGREIGAVDDLIDCSVIAVAGTHGLERRNAQGHAIKSPPHPALPMAKKLADEFVRSRPGLRRESKELSVPIHYRSAPEYAEAVTAFGRELAEKTGLAMQQGDMVIELRTPGADKGDAVAAFMAEAPFKGARPVFVGDDLTDEHGFELVENAGGEGVLVGPPRATHASRALPDVNAVLAWLSRH